MKLPEKDYYRLLDVPVTADIKDIRQAHRRLSKLYHPDLNPDSEVIKRMELINEAFNVLSLPAKRKDYDSLPIFQVRIPPKEKVKEYYSTAKEKEKKDIVKRVKLFFHKTERTTEKVKKILAIFKLAASYASSCKPFSWDMAEEEFKKILQIDPSHFETLYNLGLLAYRKAKWKEALKYFSKTLEINPQDEASKLMVNLLTLEEI